MLEILGCGLVGSFNGWTATGGGLLSSIEEWHTNWISDLRIEDRDWVAANPDQFALVWMDRPFATQPGLEDVVIVGSFMPSADNSGREGVRGIVFAVRSPTIRTLRSCLSQLAKAHKLASQATQSLANKTGRANFCNGFITGIAPSGMIPAFVRPTGVQLAGGKSDNKGAQEASLQQRFVIAVVEARVRAQIIDGARSHVWVFRYPPSRQFGTFDWAELRQDKSLVIVNDALFDLAVLADEGTGGVATFAQLAVVQNQVAQLRTAVDKRVKSIEAKQGAFDDRVASVTTDLSNLKGAVLQPKAAMSLPPAVSGDWTAKPAENSQHLENSDTQQPAPTSSPNESKASWWDSTRGWTSARNLNLLLLCSNLVILMLVALFVGSAFFKANDAGGTKALATPDGLTQSEAVSAAQNDPLSPSSPTNEDVGFAGDPKQQQCEEEYGDLDGRGVAEKIVKDLLPLSAGSADSFQKDCIKGQLITKISSLKGQGDSMKSCVIVLQKAVKVSPADGLLGRETLEKVKKFKDEFCDPATSKAAKLCESDTDLFITLNQFELDQFSPEEAEDTCALSVEASIAADVMTLEPL